jgi:hypothetical protein
VGLRAPFIIMAATLLAIAVGSLGLKIVPHSEAEVLLQQES